MDFAWLLILSSFLFVGGYIAWQLFLEKMCDRAASLVSEEEFTRIVEELKKVGTAESKSYSLKPKSDATINGSFCIDLPRQMDIQWLKSKRVLVSLNPSHLSEDTLGEVSLVTDVTANPDFDLIPIPRIKFKKGGGANQYTSKFWFRTNPSMQVLVEKIYPRDPSRLLSSLLDSHGRVNAPFEWLQHPPRMSCECCSRKLLPVLQVNGLSIGLNGEATYYLAACPNEKGKFEIFEQFS